MRQLTVSLDKITAERLLAFCRETSLHPADVASKVIQSFYDTYQLDDLHHAVIRDSLQQEFDSSGHGGS